jgi:hypothetical protein
MAEGPTLISISFAIYLGGVVMWWFALVIAAIIVGLFATSRFSTWQIKKCPKGQEHDWECIECVGHKVSVTKEPMSELSYYEDDVFVGYMRYLVTMRCAKCDEVRKLECTRDTPVDYRKFYGNARWLIPRPNTHWAREIEKKT